MTTVRKLVLELGVLGDDIAKQRITEFQDSANALKHTLIEVEQQLEVLGRANFPIGSTGISGPVLTSHEKESMEKQTQLIKEQTQSAKERDERQITLQEKLIDALQDQSTGQMQIIKDIASEMKTDRQFFITISKEMAGIIDAALGYIKKEERPLGATGPTPHEHIRDPQNRMKWIENPKYKEFMQPLTDLSARMEDAAHNLNQLPAELLQNMQDDIKRISDSTKKLGEPVKQHLDNLSKLVENAKEEIVKGFIGDPEQEVKTVKETITAIARTKKIDTSNRDSFDDRLKQVQIDLQTIQDNDKIKELYDSARSTILKKHGIDSLRGEVASSFMEDMERDDIKERMSKIRAEMQEEYDHDKEIKKRGFAWMPEERVRDLSKKATKWAESTQTDIEQRVGNWLGSNKYMRKLGFKPAEEYLKEKENQRQNEGEKVAAEIESEYQKQRVIANITINNPVVDSDERKEQLIKEITNAFRGIS